MPEPGRSDGGQRRYGDTELVRLAFIRHARQLCFPLEAIRELLGLSDDPDRDCGAADSIARLEALRGERERMINACRAGTTSTCRVLDVLRDHSECLTDHGDGGL